MGHLLSGSMLGLMVTSSKRAYATGSVIQDSCIQSPWPCNRPLLTYTSTGDIRTQVWLSLCWFSGSCCAQGFVCALQNSVSPGLCKFCNQFPLTSKVKFPGGSQSLCQIPRFIDYAKAFDCVDHKKLWKVLKEMGIADHLTCLLRNLLWVLALS